MNWFTNFFKVKTPVSPVLNQTAEEREDNIRRYKLEKNRAYGPLTRPTDGFQPSAKRFLADRAPVTYDRHDSGLTDALLIANLLSATNEQRATRTESAEVSAPAPDVKVTVRDYTYEPPAPSYSPPEAPAPAPSYAPTYDSSPSYDSSSSYSSSDSFSSSSSFD